MKSVQPNDDNIKKQNDEEDWRDEHGNPSNDFLQSLANNGSIEALNKLRSIAEDLDAEYSPGSSAQELIDVIRMATGNDPNITT